MAQGRRREATAASTEGEPRAVGDPEHSTAQAAARRRQPRADREPPSLGLESAFALNHQLIALQAIGASLINEAELRNDNDVNFVARLRSWINQVASTITTGLPRTTYLREEATRLIERAGSESVLANSAEKRLLIGDAQQLLTAAQEWIKPDHRDDLSDALKKLIYQTLVEQYFRRWPWVVLATAVSMFAAVLFGGTFYAGYKLEGVVNKADALTLQAEGAQKKIAGAQSDVDTALKAVVEETKGKARTASNDELAVLQTNLDQQLQTNQTSSQGKMDAALRSATTQIDTQEKSAAATLTEQLKMSSQSLTDSTKVALNGLGQNIATETGRFTASVNGAVQTISAQAEIAKAKIDSSVSLAEQYQGQLKQMVKTAETQLPNEIQTAVATLREFDGLVGAYRTPIDEFVNRLQDNRKLSNLEAAAVVLGWARWLIAGALVVLVASLMSLAVVIALYLRIRRRLAAPLAAA